jgi:signal transduction histidine kinase
MAVPDLTLRVSWRERFQRLANRAFEQRWTNVGLRAKMGLLIEVGVIGLIAIFLLVGVNNARVSTRQILNERVMLARLSAATLDSNLRHVNSVLRIIASRTMLRDPAAISEDVQVALDEGFAQVRHASQGIYLLDKSGKPGYAARQSAVSIPWVDLPVFHEPVSPGTLAKIYLLSDSRPWAVQVVPVIDNAGQQTGWLAAVLDFDSADLAPFRSVMDLGESGTLDLVEADGRVLISSYPGRDHVNSQPDPLISKFFVGGSPVVETCLGCASGDPAEGSDEVIAFAPLSQAPWGVVVRQKANELMAPVNRLLFQTLLLGAATICGALALVWVTTASVIRPVQSLKDSADRITAGDLDTPLEVLSSGWLSGRRKRRDEIGALADSFESMRQQLKRSMDQTQALNRELDARVQDRTQDARQAQLQAQAARDHLLRRNQQLSILNAIATTVNQSLNLQDILERSLDAVLRLTEVDIGAVFLLDEIRGALELMAYRGLSKDAAENVAEFGLLDKNCGGVFEHGELVVVPDLSHYRSRRARTLQRENLSTLVHVPLTAKGSILGSMCVGTHLVRDFDPEEQQLLTALGSQIAVAIENARLYAEVQHKERMRGELFKKALNAQEEERRRIARELHDETSQSLTALLFAAETACEMDELREVRQQLNQMHGWLQHTLDGVHKIIFDLRPSMLDHLGLVPAIRSLAKSRLEERGVRVVVQEVGQPARLAPEMETALYRVIQEAISNIARHAAARNVTITCALNGPVVEVVVEDDGIGFDIDGLSLSPDSPRGLGLLGMQERLELLGGEVQILTHPGSGTELRIRVALDSGTKLNG